MTATLAADSATAPSHPPTAPHGALRARRSPRLVAIGVLLACLGGLGAGAAWSRASHVDEVVVMVNPVARGEVVEASDVGTTSLSAAGDVATVPASEISTLIGKQALTDLPAGSLVGPASTGTPPANKGSVVGLRLPAGRLPQLSMPAGTKVLLVPVGSSQAGAQPVSAAPTEATVVTAPQPLQDGASWVVDVEVPADQAAAVAQLAAGEQLVLIKAPGA